MLKPAKIFKKLDSFGEGMNFTIKGRDKFKTGFGALITLLIYIVVLVYGSKKLTDLSQKQDTVHQQSKFVNEIAANQAFSLSEIGANFAFSLWSNKWVPTQFTTENVGDYVHIEASILTNKFVNGQVQSQVTILPMHPCNESDTFYKP